MMFQGLNLSNCLTFGFPIRDVRVETFDRFTNEALSYILLLMKDDAFLNDI